MPGIIFSDVCHYMHRGVIVASERSVIIQMTPESHVVESVPLFYVPSIELFKDRTRQ